MQSALYQKAVRYYNKGNFRKARRYLERAKKDDVNNADALFLKGQIAYAEKTDLDRSRTLINKAINIKPDASDYHLWLAMVCAEQKDVDQAIQSLQRCLELAPDEYRAQALLADLFRSQGRYEDAYRLYKGLKASIQMSPIGHYYLMDCLDLLPFSGYSPTLEHDVIEFLQQETLEHGKYSRYICVLCKDKYHLKDPTQQVDIATLGQDELFLRLLKQVSIQDSELEMFVTSIRRSLLLDCLENSALPDHYFELVIAIANQNLNNEYVFTISADEKLMFTALDDLIGLLLEQTNMTSDQLVCAVIVLAMYQSVYDSKHAEALLAISIDSWPQQARELLQRSLFDLVDEIRRAAELPTLTQINDTTSLAVQSQYEENPYPRWINLTQADESYSLGRQIRMETTSNSALPTYLNGEAINILVAGCGSGKQPLQLAKVFTKNKILAVDLSRRSLAYAQRMAEKYDVKNVRFLQADILEIGQLDEKFHVIYCTGVLHHMREPLQGWNVLKQLLVPDGMMKIGLYSEIARQAVVKVREFINSHAIQSSPDNIRAVRQGLMDGQLGNEIANKIPKSHDFYAMSSCRDLLFHVQEHRLTLPRLQQMLQSLNLNFLGFQLPERHHFQNYQRLFPEDVDLTDLDHWAAYEQLHPHTFGNMYQFWCRAKD
ncbi:MAG: methyltransferase domain-containing protein [Gammaproteobacteria bacterium]|nr:methyltransferase domain-containing protein [Gammaproteobacteria bacterium]